MWFRVERLGAAAERLAEQLRKGNKVYAEGQLRAREYEARDGQKRTSLELALRPRRQPRAPRPRDEGCGHRRRRSGGAYGDAPPQVQPRGAETSARRRPAPRWTSTTFPSSSD